MKHKLRSLLLVMTTMATSVPVTAHDFEDGGIYYAITSSTSNTVSVTYKGSSYSSFSNEYSGRVVIPTTVVHDGQNYQVTAIASNAFRDCSQLYQIEIPASVKTINTYALYNCTALTSVTLANGVTTLGSSSFMNCPNLSKIIMLPTSAPAGLSSAFDTSTSRVTYVPNDNYTSYTSYLGSIEVCANINSRLTVDGVIFVPTSLTANNMTCKAIDCEYSSDVERITIPASVNYRGRALAVKDMGYRMAYNHPYVTRAFLTHYGDISSNAFRECTNLQIAELACTGKVKTFAFCNCPQLSEVSIAETVNALGDNVFYGCTALSTITLPSSVTSLGTYAFYGCTSLLSVELSENIDSIAAKTFYNCLSLPCIKIPAKVGGIADMAFYGCKSLATVEIEDSHKPLYMGYNGSSRGLFYDCPLSSVCTGRRLIFNTSSSYGYSPFYGNSYLHTVIMHGGESCVLANMFQGCSNLTSVQLDNEVTQIGTNAFYGCSNLSEISMSNATAINSYAFYNCFKLKDVSLPKIQTVGDYAFQGCNSLETLNLGDNLQNIGIYAFDGCSSLKAVRIPASATTVDSYAFRNCTSLSNVVIDDANSTLTFGRTNSSNNHGYTVFSGCANIDSVYIGRTLNYYNNNDSPFSNKSKLRTVVLGNNVTSIYSYMFYGCSGLTHFTMGDNLSKINSYALYNTGIANLTIPSSVTQISNYAIGSRKLKNVIIEDSETPLMLGYYGYNGSNGQFYSPVLDSLYLGRDISYSTNYPPFANTILRTAVIGDKVTGIGNFFFNNCSNLTTTIIGSNVVSIGASAFAGTGIINLNIPKSVTSIANEAFNSATHLTRVLFEDGELPLYLGYNNSQKGLFYSCPLDSVYVGRSLQYNTNSSYGYSPFAENVTLRAVHLGSYVTTLTDYMFNNCTMLESAVVGGNVESIGNYTFSGCSAIRTLRSYNGIPPVCGTDALASIDKWGCTLIVPENSISLYAEAQQWQEFLFTETQYVNFICRQPTAFDVSLDMDSEQGQTYQWYTLHCQQYPLLPSYNDLYYPWQLQTDGSWKSGNAGYHNTTSTLIYTIKLNAGEKLSFTWSVSSESSYDKFTAILNGQTIVNAVSGNASNTYTTIIDHPMVCTLRLSYSKDGSNNTGTDCATIKFLEPTTQHVIDATPITGATSAELNQDLRTVGDTVCCIVTLPEGIRISSDTVTVAQQAAVALYDGNEKMQMVSSNNYEDIITRSSANALLYVSRRVDTNTSPVNVAVMDNEQQWKARQLVLTDGQPFYNPNDVQAEVISYTRDFTTANWQALYLPFDVQYEDWADKADVAYINDVHQFDDDEDGRVERTVIEYLYKKSGTISANKPYLIRPKQTGEMTLTSRNATLKATPATGGSVDCSSTTMLYTLTGTYQTITNMYDRQWYALSDGALRQASHSGVTLAPFRFYLNITDRDGNPVSDIDRPSYVRLMIGGLMIDEETGIETPDANTGNADGRVYDLQGRRVETPKHGLYIIGGKKTIIK